MHVEGFEKLLQPQSASVKFFCCAIQNSGVIDIDATTNGACSRKRKENLRNKGQSVNAEICKFFCAGGSSIINTVEQRDSSLVERLIVN